MDKERIKILRIAAPAEVDECLDEIERLQPGLVSEVDLRGVIAGDKRDAPKIIVRMQRGEDPRSFDADTGEEITGVVEIRILPLKKAVAILNRLDENGKHIIEAGNLARFEATVVRIEGVWETESGMRCRRFDSGEGG